MTDEWVFGYGSLASPVSFARTVERPVVAGPDFLAGRLAGFSRAWNYGSLRQRGDWDGPHGPVVGGIVVSLGLRSDPRRSCNGAVVKVTPDELALLDWRESDYDRVDVSDHVRTDDDRTPGRVWVYVPRPSAIERYNVARTDRRAAVRRSYVELVARAFADLGRSHHDEYVATTPEPDVPVLDFP